jgi:hypothetical protein
MDGSISGGQRLHQRIQRQDRKQVENLIGLMLSQTTASNWKRATNI